MCVRVWAGREVQPENKKTTRAKEEGAQGEERDTRTGVSLVSGASLLGRDRTVTIWRDTTSTKVKSNCCSAGNT